VIRSHIMLAIAASSISIVAMKRNANQAQDTEYTSSEAVTVPIVLMLSGKFEDGPSDIKVLV